MKCPVLKGDPEALTSGELPRATSGQPLCQEEAKGAGWECVKRGWGERERGTIHGFFGVVERASVHKGLILLAAYVVCRGNVVVTN